MKFRDKWKKVWNFEKKMYFVIGVSIFLLMLATIGVSTISSVLTLTKRNRQYVLEQLDTMAEDYADNLNQYKAMAISIVMDKEVQRYCAAENIQETYPFTNGVYNALMNVLNIWNNVNFIAVINGKCGNYVYNGNQSIHKSNFEKGYEEDYKSSIQAHEKSSLRTSFSEHYDKKNSLTIYFPVYSVTQIFSENGMLVINLNDSILQRLWEKNNLTNTGLYLLDKSGTVVSGNADLTGTHMPYADKLTQKRGEFWNGNRRINYRHVGKWNYYLIHEMTVWELYGDVVRMVLIMLLMTVVVTVCIFAATRQMLGRLYQPINKIVTKMNDVSEGDLRTRIHTIDSDSDSKKLAVGFNRMMDEIDLLMAQVKEEEQQVTKMELNALQSQIQPHFLYNTLECIHWQAAADGNREISVMVKALAQYYRLCLSGGKDIITLETELNHIRNYVIIQNMRYDNIIDLQINVTKEYQGLLLPKLTLQPLVENSIYHGLRVKEGRKGRVEISVQDEGDDIFLLVSDNGQGMKSEEIDQINRTIREFDRTIGYGINNVNKRLELLFGETYGLRFESNTGDGVTARIRLPKSNVEKEEADV